MIGRELHSHTTPFARPHSQAVGAIPAVALLILPGACGLLVARRVPGVLAVAAVHALLSALGGFYLAWFAGINAASASAIVLAGFGWLSLGWLRMAVRGGRACM